jgi:hypothetical protein
VAATLPGPPLPTLPDSLLTRLLLYALVVAAAEVHRVATEHTGPVLEPIVADASQPTQLEDDASAMTEPELTSGGPAVDMYNQVQSAFYLLFELREPTLERTMRATLDAAAYRIDPWITAYATRRLERQTAATHQYRLGAYGWVDAPRPGTPGPTQGGLLHAPSEQQAAVAAILRDRAIHDVEPGRWQMNLESSTIRLAEQVAEEVRLGAHISEALGRAVERAVGTPATVETLRAQYPIRKEHAGRRVCDGQAVLAADVATLPLTAQQRAALEPLRQALDSYSDLLVADAVQHVVASRGDVAGAAMDAAAGLAGPPDLEVISTRRTGRAVNTNVIFALPPTAAPPVTIDTSPATVADPAVAAFLTTVLGHQRTAPWTWPVLQPGKVTRNVVLAELDLTPIDTVVLSEEALAQLVLEAAAPGSILNTRWPVTRPDGTVQIVQLSDLDLEPQQIALMTDDELTRLLRARGPTGSVVGPSEAPSGLQQQRRARRIIDVLGSQPAVPGDLLDTGAQPRDDAVRSELHTRYQQLHQLADIVLATLQSAMTPADAIKALRLAARWGITPAGDVGDTPLDRVVRAHAALTARKAAAPSGAALDKLTAQQLAAAIAELAAPEGQLAVLSRIDLRNWPTPLAEAPALNGEWLTLNAAVRMPVARLEAFQLDAELEHLWPALSVWSNRPNDPWQLAAPVSANGTPLASRMIAVFGPAGAVPVPGATDATVAVALLDSWGETIPDPQQATTAAFGFDAPAARAPQAILIAVGPDPTAPLTPETLLDIVAETRELARARMATPAELHQLDVALPLMMLPAMGNTAVVLKPQP